MVPKRTVRVRVLAPAVAGPVVPRLVPLSGGTHAAAVAAGDSALRRLLFYSLESVVAGAHGSAQAPLAEAAGIHEEETEEALVGHVLISRPAVVVTDVDLAEGSGLAACERIKHHPLTRATAVVVISSRYERADFDRALAAGADAFLSKPFSPLRLRRLVAELGAEAMEADAQQTGQRGSQRGTPVMGGRPRRRADLQHPERFDLPPELMTGDSGTSQRAG